MKYYVELSKADMLDELKTLERLGQEFSAVEAMLDKSPEEMPLYDRSAELDWEKEQLVVRKFHHTLCLFQQQVIYFLETLEEFEQSDRLQECQSTAFAVKAEL